MTQLLTAPLAVSYVWSRQAEFLLMHVLETGHQLKAQQMVKSKSNLTLSIGNSSCRWPPQWDTEHL